MAVTSATSRVRDVITPRPDAREANLRTAGALKYVFPAFYGKRLKVADKVPTHSIDEGWKGPGPNGNLMFEVALGSVMPGAMDAPSRSAIVDPKKNEFYFRVYGGMPGPSGIPTEKFYGPVKLPERDQFTTTQRPPFRPVKFDPETIAALAVAANKPAGPGLAQVRVTYEKLDGVGALPWGGTMPPEADIEKKTVVVARTPMVTAITLRSNPNLVVFQRESRTTEFSQPVMWRSLNVVDLKEAKKRVSRQVLDAGANLIGIGNGFIEIKVPRRNAAVQAQIANIMSESAPGIPFRVTVGGAIVLE